MSGGLAALVGAALAAAVLALVLKKDSPALSLAVGLAGVLCLMWGMLEPAAALYRAVRELMGGLEHGAQIYGPVVKAEIGRAHV